MSSSPARILYIPFDHLNRQRGVLKDANPAVDRVVLVESQRMLTGRNWHPLRLFFMVSAARHFADELRADGFSVDYVQAPTTIDGLEDLKKKHAGVEIVCAEPSSFEQSRALTDFGVRFVENDFFLTSRVHFRMWADKQSSYVMENFYRAQRQRLSLLMDNGKPVGGRWNFDSDNRLPPPKNYEWPEYFVHERDGIDVEVAERFGVDPGATWATTRSGALAQLDYFIANHLAGFGPYEDAIPADNWAVHHSLLSPYLNVGLLHAEEVVAAAVESFNAGRAPIESVEAFVRQIIGWREYINGMYWYLGEDYRDRNELDAHRALLPVFTDSSRTQMNCVGSVVRGVEERAWVHHIPRLMVLSNLALLTGVNPREFLDWMREQFIDASDWVMVPNIIGMATHADGGELMTKPYASGGAYLSRMTQYCKGCAYDPKLRIGDRACPYTTLYWDFLDRHRERFADNHRMFQQINGLKRLSDLPELKLRAAEVLHGLGRGTV